MLNDRDYGRILYARQNQQIARRMALLRAHATLGRQSTKNLLALACNGSFVTFLSGDKIAEQGTRARSIYFIASGEATCSARAADGSRHELSRIATNGVVGISSALGGSPQAYDVRAQGSVETMCLGIAALRKSLSKRVLELLLESAEEVSIGSASRGRGVQRAGVTCTGWRAARYRRCVGLLGRWRR